MHQNLEWNSLLYEDIIPQVHTFQKGIETPYHGQTNLHPLTSSLDARFNPVLLFVSLLWFDLVWYVPNDEHDVILSFCDAQQEPAANQFFFKKLVSPVYL